MGRKKKTAKDEVREGLKRLAFGEIQDAVLLLFADEEEIEKRLPELNLYNISEIKRPKGGGMEIRFFDRIKALEKLSALDSEQTAEPLNFYRALEESAKSVKSVFEEDLNE